MIFVVSSLLGPNPVEAQQRRPPAGERPIGATIRRDGQPADRDSLQPLQPTRPTSVARVSHGTGTLPNDHGQVWREYDLTPYTRAVTNTQRPEQTVVDWILRETGYELWHSEVVAVLSADGSTLRVYHTPEVQTVVGRIVDRFVSVPNQQQNLGVKVLSVSRPDWRQRAQTILRPMVVETAGVQAWVLRREDSALLLADLAKRFDYRQHSAAGLSVLNGQSTSVIATRPRNFVQEVALAPEQWPGVNRQMAQIHEGLSLEVSPLLSIDGAVCDVMLKCSIDQVETVHPVTLEAGGLTGPRQRTQVEVPQLAQFRLHERFRWPADQVILISTGVAPQAVPQQVNNLLLGNWTPARTELLILLEPLGRRPGADPARRPEPAATNTPAPRTTQNPAGNVETRGRY